MIPPCCPMLSKNPTQLLKDTAASREGLGLQTCISHGPPRLAILSLGCKNGKPRTHRLLVTQASTASTASTQQTSSYCMCYAVQLHQSAAISRQNPRHAFPSQGGPPFLFRTISCINISNVGAPTPPQLQPSIPSNNDVSYSATRHFQTC